MWVWGFYLSLYRNNCQCVSMILSKTFYANVHRFNFVGNAVRVAII